MSNLFEHSTIEVLIAAKLDGTITLTELLKHGNYGLGTFTGLDGEVIILDNDVYQVDQTGTVNHITDMDTTLPFASVHKPSENEQPLTLAKADFTLLNQTFAADKNLKNVFATIKLHGHFNAVKVRVAPKQEKPYPSLLAVTKNQPIFDTENVSGTIIGYYAPELFGNITAAGWHLHFLSDDHQFGGHLLSFVGSQLDGTFEIFDGIEQHFPINDVEFRNHENDLETLKAAIEESEGFQD
jgi:acetolactate decarboxylase